MTVQPTTPKLFTYKISQLEEFTNPLETIQPRSYNQLLPHSSNIYQPIPQQYTIWNRTYGGISYDVGNSVVECVGGGFAIAGYTGSYGAGISDFWLVRTDSAGNHLWNQTYGGTQSDKAISVVECAGGGFAIAGYTDSFGAGGNDFWLVRVKEDLIWWMEELSDQLVELGVPFRYDLNATSIFDKHKWWLNDTTCFDIDGQGVVTNITKLAIGSIGLQIWVNDTQGNVLTGTFNVIVQDTTPPSWDQIPANQIIEFGDSFQYNLYASDMSGIDYYWVNDTTNFEVNPNTGLITNITSLEVSVFSLEVRAYDIYGNYCNAIFTVTVEETTTTPTGVTPIPGFYWQAIIPALVGALFIGLVRKRRVR